MKTHVVSLRPCIRVLCVAVTVLVFSVPSKATAYVPFAGPYPYVNGFEAGTGVPLGPEWETLVTGDGAVKVTNAFPSAETGSYHLEFSKSVIGTSTQEAILHLDLSGTSSASLDFGYKHEFDSFSYGAASTKTRVMVRPSSAAEWHTVLSFDYYSRKDYAHYGFDLGLIAAAKGWTLGSDFQVRFYQSAYFDTASIYFDNVRVMVPAGDLAGPRVVSQTPLSTAWQTAMPASLEVEFDEAITPGSFTSEDITVRLPWGGYAGGVIPAEVPGLSGRRFLLTLPPSLAVCRGTFQVTIGPAIFDLAGNPMNQNGDARNGETAADGYVAFITVSPQTSMAQAGQTIAWEETFEDRASAYNGLALSGTTIERSVEVSSRDGPHRGKGHLRFALEPQSKSVAALFKFNLSALAGRTDVYLDYWIKEIISNGAPKLLMEVSGNGTQWTTAVTRNYSPSTWTREVVPLGALAAGAGIALDADVYVRITYSDRGASVEDSRLLLDDMRITAGGSALWLLVDPDRFPQNAGVGSVLTVSRINTATTSSALTVNLSSSDPSLTLPATVTIAAGARDAVVNLTATELDAGALERTATLSASASGQVPASTTVTLTPSAAPALSAQFSLPEVREGDGVGGLSLIVRRSHSIDQALTVTVASSDPGELYVPAPSFTFAAGETAKAVPLDVVNDGAIDGPQSVTLTCSAPGNASSTSTISVQDDDTPGTHTLGGRMTEPLVPGTYQVRERLQVPSGVNWTVPAGSVLQFARKASLWVEGSLQVTGTEASPVWMGRTTDASSGAWDGIYFSGGSSTRSVIDWLDISGASGGISVSMSDNFRRVSVLNSNIHHHSGDGIYCYVGETGVFGDDVVFLGNRIHDNSGDGIELRAYAYGCDSGSNNARVEANEIWNNKGAGVSAVATVSSLAYCSTRRSAYVGSTITGNILRNNLNGIHGVSSRDSQMNNASISMSVTNNLIIGNASAGVKLDTSHGGTSSQIVNNTIVDNNGAGFSGDLEASDWAVRNNIISGNGIGIEAFGTAASYSPAVTRNDVHGNATNWSGLPAAFGSLGGPPVLGLPADTSGNVTVDPGFIDRVEFKLGATSLLRDLGLTTSAPVVDFFETARLGAPDVGYHETTDLIVRFLEPSSTLLENSVVNVSLLRQGNTSQPTTVTVSTADGTASAGADYVSLTATSVTFAAGEASKMVSLTTQADTETEGDETFQLLLSTTGSNAQPGALTVHTLTIQNGQPTVAFSAHPQSQVVNPGVPVTFSVSASGPAALNYQWRSNGQPISGATASTYSIAAAAQSHEGNYDVVVNGAVSQVASLMVNDPVSLTSPLDDQTVQAGSTAVFSVSVSGTTPITYQWRKGASPIPGETGLSLTLANAAFSAADTYSVVVTNPVGSTTWSARLIVLSPPIIVSQPVSAAVRVDTAHTFSLAVTGSAPFSYQWRRGTTAIPGATGPQLVIAPVSAADFGAYDCVVTNVIGPATSQTVQLTELVPVTITTPPASASVDRNSAITFSVSATGSAPLSYQWRKGGATIPGATLASYSIPSVQFADAGSYTVAVTNAAGTVISAAAVLTVSGGIVITIQPQSTTLSTGQYLGLGITASGPLPLSYQWRKNGQPLTGSIGPSYGKVNVQESDAGDYDVLLSDSSGRQVVSAAAKVTVPRKPVISTDLPPALTVNPGASLVLTVELSGGDAPFTYTWRKLNHGNSQTAFTTASTVGKYTISNASDSSAAVYDCMISNAGGTTFTRFVVVNLTQPVKIVRQPAATSVGTGAALNLSASASGSPPLAWQWRKNGAAIPDATAATLHIPAATEGDAGDYDVVVSNALNTVTSQSSTVNVHGGSPLIITPPPSAVAEVGDDLRLSVAAAGQAPLSYQWRKNGVDIPGRTTAELKLAPLTMNDAASYDVVVTNALGSATCEPAVLQVRLAPDYDFTTLFTGADQPWHLAWADGSLFFTDAANGAASMKATFFDGGGASYTPIYFTRSGAGATVGMFNLRGIAVGPDGTPFVSASYSNTISQISGGSALVIAGHPGIGLGSSGSQDGPGAAAYLDGPAGMDIDADGALYFMDSGNMAVRKISPTGEVTRLFSQRGQDVKRTRDGHFVVADDVFDNIYEFDATGNYLWSTLSKRSGADGPASVAGLRGPSGLALTPGGQIIVADTGNHTVRKVSAGHVFSTIGGLAGKPGSTNGRGSSARFNSPHGVIVAPDGTIYVADTANHSIRRGVPVWSPQILDAPDSRLVGEGQSATLTCDAVGTAISYQWSKNGTAIKGATAASFTVSPASLTSAGSYTVAVRNVKGSISTSSAQLAVIRQTPTARVVNETRTLDLTQTYAGTGLTFQWSKDGVPLVNGGRVSGADKSRLLIQSSVNEDEGSYQCTVVQNGTSKLDGSIFTVKVLRKPVLDTFTTGDWVMSGPLHLQLSAQRDPATYRISGLPTGVACDPLTGLISGRPLATGSFRLGITASNAAGTSTTQYVTVIVQPLPALVKGSFHGLISRSITDALGQNLGGTITLTVGSTGAFTGSLKLEGRDHSFAGQLNAQIGGPASASLQVKRSAPLVAVPLVFTISDTDGHLTGQVGSLAASPTVEAWRNGWSTTTIGQRAGRYVAALTLDDAALNQQPALCPQGHGVATLIIATTGIGTWTGNLADGTAVSRAASIGPQGQFPLHSTLYSATGSVHGWIGTTTDAVSGTATWFKKPRPPVTTDRLYPGGILEHRQIVTGEKYVRPLSGNALGLPQTDDNARFIFSSGGIESSIAAGDPNLAVTLSSANKFVITKANPAALSITFDAATGVISGKFTLKDGATRTASYTGRAFPLMHKALGYFTLQQLPISSSSLSQGGKMVVSDSTSP